MPSAPWWSCGDDQTEGSAGLTVSTGLLAVSLRPRDRVTPRQVRMLMPRSRAVLRRPAPRPIAVRTPSSTTGQYRHRVAGSISRLPSRFRTEGWEGDRVCRADLVEGVD